MPVHNNHKDYYEFVTVSSQRTGCKSVWQIATTLTVTKTVITTLEYRKKQLMLQLKKKNNNSKNVHKKEWCCCCCKCVTTKKNEEKIFSQIWCFNELCTIYALGEVVETWKDNSPNAIYSMYCKMWKGNAPNAIYFMYRKMQKDSAPNAIYSKMQKVQMSLTPCIIKYRVCHEFRLMKRDD